MPVAVPFDRLKIAEFCRKWQVTALALFGSALRRDFGPHSAGWHGQPSSAVRVPQA
jgi:hypothetical protein